MTQQFTGTMPVAERHRFAVEPLADWLRSHIDRFAGPLTVEQFRGGQSNPTYLLSTPTARYVMRSKPAPLAQLLPSAHAIEREYRVMAALHPAAVPVPRMFARCDDEAIIGRAFFIMDYVPGRVLWDQTLPAMSKPERAAIYQEMNRVIAALHALDPAQIGLADYGRPGNYLARQIARWSAQFRASETEPIEAMHQLMAWLPGRIPATGSVAVVHGDYRLDNLVFHPTEPRILAILDWELSTLGDPLADFSYHCLSWHIPPGRFRGIAGEDIAALGIPSEHDYVRAYTEHSGRSVPADSWDFYIAYNLFRLAAILQGIMKRAVEGIAASDQALEAGSRARWLAEAGWQIACRLEAGGDQRSAMNPN